jgi:hypothetical protein
MTQTLLHHILIESCIDAGTTPSLVSCHPATLYDIKEFSRLGYNAMLFDENLCFGETCHLRIQDKRVSQARNHREASSNQSLLHALFLLYFLISPEDGCGTFFLNAGTFTGLHLSLYPRRQNS